MKKELVAPELWRLAAVPPDVVNVYLAGDVLIDAGGRLGSRRLLAALQGQRVAAHALTHAHLDHQGASHEVCETLGLPLWCGRGDRDAMESGNLASLLPEEKGWLARLSSRLGGPAHPVDRVLVDGDRVGDFTVLETPGHTPGHLAFWREQDRVLILGDVAFNRSPVTLRRGLREPFAFATWDAAENRRSAKKMAALQPKVICFGHGKPLRSGTRFREFAASLGD
jgi:glyoxylase-like metal-dependent hydrolase (beta-lactamase superfamily II)